MTCDRLKTPMGAAVVLLVAAFTALPAGAQDVTPPTEDVPLESCATAQCHGAVKNFTVVHGPVNTDGCDACHTLTDAAAHEYELAEDETELCASCHDDLGIEDAAVAHAPAAGGECLACHHPHGGVDRFSLRGETEAASCLDCHDDPAEDMASVHGPIAAGRCGACHEPHGGEHEALLSAEGNELCLSCHSEFGDALETFEFPHEAMEGDCTDCHDPHASDHVAHINAPPAELCGDCHDDIGQLASEAKHKHSAVTDGKACVNCHAPHGSAHAKLLADQPLKVCLTCHAEAIPREKGRPIASMAALADPKQMKHGPIQQGQCAGCHSAHGSDLAGLLTKAHPKSMYAPFKLEQYSLCFSCHDSQLVLAQQTDKATAFRDGRRDLHYVHVKKRKGRACGICHYVHAGGAKALMRDAIPMGRWSLPIKFRATKTGGFCAAGCHRTRRYDRVKPVDRRAQP